MSNGDAMFRFSLCCARQSNPSSTAFPTPEDHEELFVCVETPGPGDAEFLALWVQAAKEADTLLNRHFSTHPDFRTSIARLEVEWLIEFTSAVMNFIREWLNEPSAFRLGVFSEWAEIFPIMVAAGFFRRTGVRYQMDIPRQLDISAIIDALGALAATEDEECYIHPDTFLVTLSRQEVEHLQDGLKAMDWQDRIKARERLMLELEASSDYENGTGGPIQPDPR